MNPGVVEEASKTINNVVDALKATPMTIAMIATNVTLLAFLFYSQTQFYNQRQELSKHFLDSEREVRQLLANCVPVDKK